MQGIILFAHGARDARWAAPFETIRDQVSQACAINAVPVVLAYLELMTPDLAAAAAQLVAKGVDVIRIVPLFLGQGGHLRRDLPILVEALQSSYPAVRFEVMQAAGEDPGVQQAIVAYSLGHLGTASASTFSEN